MACLVFLYNGNCYPQECWKITSYALLPVDGKVYGEVLIDRMVESTQPEVGKEK